MILRLLSYNIHKGFTVRHRRFVLALIKSAVRSLDVDILFLQEVIGEHRHHQANVSDWPTSAQFEYLADEVWPHYAYGKNAVYDEGHHGNAILSRFPIVGFENADISSGPGERRGLLQCSVNIPENGFRIECFCTHLGVLRRGRAAQFESLCDRVTVATGAGSTQTARPFILAGDFNDWDRRLCRHLERRLSIVDAGKAAHGRVQRTFPSCFPLLALDRIYTSGASVRRALVLTGRPWSRLSDHAPLFAELEFDL